MQVAPGGRISGYIELSLPTQGGSMITPTKYFKTLGQGVDNAEAMKATVDLIDLRKKVVEILAKIEATDSDMFWWENKELMNLFMTLYKSGLIRLPTDAVERLRWIALICAECSKAEEFACGNVIIPPDYLPDDLNAMYEKVYGRAVIDEVINLRNILDANGWEAKFPE